MSRIEQAYLDQLIASVDLVGLIRQSTPLRNVGQGRHDGSCPFHAGSPEGTLIVDESTYRFSCEHCQFGGSAIGWLMYHDGHSFRSAISELSREAELDASMWIDADDLAAERADHIGLLGEVAEYYHRRLLGSSDAQQYLDLRGISLGSVQNFTLGYAPADFNAQELLKGFPCRERDLWRAGVIVRRANRSYYPRFRNRLLFPIRDALGCVVGFGGRDMIGRTPKYLNSPTSTLFCKGSTLYGLDLVEKRPLQPLILVEGYLDVIALQRAGFHRVVAPLGTSVMADHLVAGFERSNELVLCFDADSAGQSSAVRTIELAHQIMNSYQKVSVVTLPRSGIDPDEFVRSDGKDAFRYALESRVAGAISLVKHHAAGIHLSSIGECARLAHVLAPAIKRTMDESHRTELVDVLESFIGVRVA